MNKEIKTLEDLENYCKKNTGHGMNIPPFVYIDKYFEDIEKAYGNGYRAGYKERFNCSIGEAEKEADNVRNSYLAIKATQKQSCEDEDIATSFQLGLTLGLEEKHNEMDKDVISRQKLLKAINTLDKYGCDADKKLVPYKDHYVSYIRYYDAIECIKFMWPVTLQPKMGRWLPIEYDGYADGSPVWDKWECSECGYEHNGDEESLTAFCPDCGAKMEVGENG